MHTVLLSFLLKNSQGNRRNRMRHMSEGIEGIRQKLGLQKIAYTKVSRDLKPGGRKYLGLYHAEEANGQMLERNIKKIEPVHLQLQTFV